MMNEDYFKEILEAGEKLNKMPAGMICNDQDYKEIEEASPDEPTGDLIGGIPIYPFSDVERGNMVLFKERDLLNRYLELREQGEGHEISMAKVHYESSKSVSPFSSLDEDWGLL